MLKHTMAWMHERIEASKKRNINKYCRFHPLIHPDNERDIELKATIVVNKDGSMEKFLSCPRCFIRYDKNLLDKIKERRLQEYVSPKK